MAVSRIIAPLPGTINTFPQNVGGRTFNGIKALKNTLGKAHGVLTAGSSITVKLGIAAPGGRTPKFGGLNKKSAFTATYKDGNLKITAKKDAKIGSVDRLYLLQQPLVAPGHQPAGTKTLFTLEVGIAPIRMG